MPESKVLVRKKSPFKILKDYWPWLVGFLAAFGWVVTNSSNLMAVWNTPQKQQETEQSVQEYASKMDAYTAANEAANKQRDQQILMFSSWAMEQKKK